MQIMGYGCCLYDFNNEYDWNVAPHNFRSFNTYYGVSALLEAARKINFRDISSQIADGFASGRYINFLDWLPHLLTPDSCL